MCGVRRSIRLAIQLLRHCLDLALRSQAVVKGHQPGSLLLVCIPEGYCIVLTRVDIRRLVGQSSWDLCNNGDWRDL